MPIDLTTIAILASLLFGSIVGDAVLFSDPLQVHITVPDRLVAGGFTEEAAEQLFAAEATRVGQALSIVDTPDVEISSHPSVLASLVKPLGLDAMVVSLQSQLGFDAVTVHGVVQDDATGKGLEMVIVVTQPHEAPAKIKLFQADGDATALVEHGSLLVLEDVSPYRVALTDFDAGRRGDAAAMARAKDLALRALARPWNPSRATERVVLYNLLGVIALFEGDFAGAEAQFKLSEPVPQALPAAHGAIALNQAFVAVAQRRPAEAAAYFKTGAALCASVSLPAYTARIALLGGLVAWSTGDMAEAEAQLRKAIAGQPNSESSHAYLAQLLAAKGDAAGAAAERAAAANGKRFGIEIPALAQTDFWVDPVNGGIKRRD